MSNNLGAHLPDTDFPLRFDGIVETIEIYRDPYGIPHESADTVHDAFFGRGFVSAQDRFRHMDFDRYCASGRWVEYVGEDGVEQDKTKAQVR